MPRRTARLVKAAAGDFAFATDGPAAVISADIDGDGLMDVAILDPSGGRVAVWFGDRSVGLRSVTENVAAHTAVSGHLPPERLTPRERQVAALVVDGYTDAEIAALLGIGRRTVETHSANVRGKLGVKSRRELIRRGL